MTLAEIIPSLRGSLPRTLDPQLWPASVHHLPGGDVSMAGISLVELAARYDSPTVVLDDHDLQLRLDGLRRAFGDVSVAIPDGSVFAEHTPGLVAQSGLLLSVLGDGELVHAIAAGFPAERIVLDCGGLHPVTLRRARAAGVGRFIVRGVDDIDRLAVAGRAARPADVLLAITAPAADVIPIDSRRRRRRGIVTGTAGFRNALAHVNAAPGLRVVGVQTSLADAPLPGDAVETTLRVALECVAVVRADTGIELPEIAVNGGGARCENPSTNALPTPVTALDVHDFAAAQRRYVAAISTELGMSTPHVTVEPNWPLTAAAAVTLCRVQAVRAAADRVVVEVDGCTASTVRSAVNRAAMLFGRLSPEQDRLVDVVTAGCSAQSDALETLLPADVRVGDLIALPSVGAGALAMSTSAVHVAVADGRSRLLIESDSKRHALRRRVG